MAKTLWECHACGALHRFRPDSAVMVKTLKGCNLGEACCTACAMVLYDPSAVVCDPLGLPFSEAVCGKCYAETTTGHYDGWADHAPGCPNG